MAEVHHVAAVEAAVRLAAPLTVVAVAWVAAVAPLTAVVAEGAAAWAAVVERLMAVERQAAVAVERTIDLKLPCNFADERAAETFSLCGFFISVCALRGNGLDQDGAATSRCRLFQIAARSSMQSASARI